MKKNKYCQADSCIWNDKHDNCEHFSPKETGENPGECDTYQETFCRCWHQKGNLFRSGVGYKTYCKKYKRHLGIENCGHKCHNYFEVKKEIKLCRANGCNKNATRVISFSRIVDREQLETGNYYHDRQYVCDEHHDQEFKKMRKHYEGMDEL